MKIETLPWNSSIRIQHRVSPLLTEGNKAKVTGEVNQRYSECPENGEWFIEKAVIFKGT